MHLLIIGLALVIAWGIRLCHRQIGREFFTFLFPPLLLVMTAIAVLWMGPHGMMMGLPASWLGYLLAGVFLGVFILVSLSLGYEIVVSQSKISSYPRVLVENHQARLLDLDLPYSAQTGFWYSQLVVSRGLLELLTPEQLTAVLAHEQAHAYYRDTFWFFWLAVIRRSTAWLPYTDSLWQDLLLYRELRADAWGAERVDNLTLAEALFKVAASVSNYQSPHWAVGLSDGNQHRLEVRIEALLSPREVRPSFNWWYPALFSFVPLVTILWHIG